MLRAIELADAPTNANTIYAMGSDASTSGVLGVWRTDNGGDTWVQRATGRGVQTGGCANATNGGGQMWYDAGLTVDPNNAESVLLSGVDLWRSTNGGTTFQDITCGYGNGNVHVDNHARTYLPNGLGGYDSNKVLTGSDGGVYYTANAQFGSGGTSAANRPSFISLNRTLGTMSCIGRLTAIRHRHLREQAGGRTTAQNGWLEQCQSGAAMWTVRKGGDASTPVSNDQECGWYYPVRRELVCQQCPNSATVTARRPERVGWRYLSVVMRWNLATAIPLLPARLSLNPGST